MDVDEDELAFLYEVMFITDLNFSGVKRPILLLFSWSFAF